MFGAIVRSIILIIVVTQLPASAICIVWTMWNLKDTAFINGDDPAIAFSVIKNGFDGNPAEEVFKDTVYQSEYQSELLSDLKRSYDSSASVVVACISQVKKFVMEPDSYGEYFYAESVTVKIEKVIKGSFDKMERIFISRLKDGSYKHAYDNQTGDSIIIYSPISSLYDQGYKEIEGMRFLLFLNEKESSDSNLTIQKPVRCGIHEFGYLVDSSNKVYYDGLEIDATSKKIKKVSLLKVDLDKVVQTLSISPTIVDNITSVKFENRTIKQVRSSKYRAYCDLMGKRVRTNISDRHTNASRRIVSYDDVRKNHAKMTLK